MKRKHTQARKARRPSGFRSQARHGLSSSRRQLKRDNLQPKEPKTFGEQVVRVQRIPKGHDQFGNPKYILVPHAAQ